MGFYIGVGEFLFQIDGRAFKQAQQLNYIRKGLRV